MNSKHPSPKELQQFVSGTLNSQRIDVVERHILHCEQCSLQIEALAESSEPINLLDRGEAAVRRDHGGGEGELTELSMSKQHPFAEGETIGDYLLDSFLGKGGNGIVFRARQLQPVSRWVAMKFAYHSVTDQDSNHRMAYERDALASVSHPNIPQFYDAGKTRYGIPFVVMEYCAGIPLSQITERIDLPLDTCFDLMLILCEAVEHAHRNGIIHRDLKPSNVLVVQAGRSIDLTKTKVIDFGIARLLDSDQVRLTRSHEVIGTLAYMSPEQLLSHRPCDTRGDVYSLGVMLYEMLTGQFPHELVGPDPTQPLSELTRQLDNRSTPISPSKRLEKSSPYHTRLPVNPERRSISARQLRGEPDWIVMKAIERDPTRRYQSAAEFAEDIRRYREGWLVKAGPPSVFRTAMNWATRHRGIVGMLGLLALVILFTSVVIATQTIESVRQSNELAWRTYVGELQMVESRFGLGHNQFAIDRLDRLRRDDRFANCWGIEADLLWRQTHPSSLIAERVAFLDGIDDQHSTSEGDLAAVLSRSSQMIQIFEVSLEGFKLRTQISAKQVRTRSNRFEERWNSLTDAYQAGSSGRVLGGMRPSPVFTSVRFAPKRKWLAIGTDCGAIVLWDYERSRLVDLIECPGAHASRIEYSRDGRHLAVVGNACWMIDVDSRTATKVFDDAVTYRGDFRPDSREFVAAGLGSSDLHFIDVETKRRIIRSVEIAESKTSTIGGVRYSKDGRTVFVTMSNTGIYRRSWNGKNLGQGELVGVTRNGARDLRVDDESRVLASTCDGGLLQLWDLETAKPIDSMIGHSGQLRSVNFSRRAKSFICSGEDGVLRMYAVSYSPRFIKLSQSPKATAMAVHPGGMCAVNGFDDGTIEVRESGSLDVIATRKTEHGQVNGLLFLSEGEELVAIFRSGVVLIWNYRTDQSFVYRHNAVASRVLVLPEKRQIGVAYRDASFRIIDDRGNLEGGFRLRDDFHFINWNTKRRCFLSVWGRGNLDHYDIGGELIDQVRIDPNIRYFRAIPNTKDLLGFGIKGALVRFDPDSGEVVQRYVGHVSKVTKAIPLDGGRRIFSVANDFTARIWDTDSGDEVLLKDGKTRQFTRFNTDQSGRLLAINYSDRTFEMIDLRLEQSQID